MADIDPETLTFYSDVSGWRVTHRVELSEQATWRQAEGVTEFPVVSGPPATVGIGLLILRHLYYLNR